MQQLYGLIGYPLSHSWSGKYFAEKFRKEQITDCHYELFPIKTIEELPELLAEYPHLKGLNVTIPYKEVVIPLLDHVDEAAASIGAVNTIKIFRQDDKIITHGYNTDVIGFEKSLEKLGVAIPVSALVLGTGGASKAVAWILQKYQCEVFYATRRVREKNHRSYDELTDLVDFTLIVNTTPLGMVPNDQQAPPIPYDTLQSHQVLIDLVYNPQETLFLKKGKQQGCQIMNGLYMLEQQAEGAWRIWQGS